MKLSVIMPVYNEKGTVLEVLERVRAVPVEKEILVVDNCSTDGTRELLEKVDLPEVRVIFQTANMRKGNSVKKGLAAAQGEFIIVQDADLEYEPQDYLPMLLEAEKEDVLAVLGSRPLGAQQRGVQLPSTVFSFGRYIIALWFRLLYRSELTDIATCYKMMRTKVAHSLELQRDGFDLDFEISCKLARWADSKALRVAEVPIYYAPRTVAEGKKINWRDGIAALRTIAQCRSWSPSDHATESLVV